MLDLDDGLAQREGAFQLAVAARLDAPPHLEHVSMFHPPRVMGGFECDNLFISLTVLS